MLKTGNPLARRCSPMLETTRHEITRRVRGTTALTVGICLYVGFIVWYFTLLEPSAYEELTQSLPPAMQSAFGVQSLSSIGGWLGGQVYTFLWLLGLGIYFAYTSAGMIAGDVETGRMDLLLSFPVSRAQLVAEKFAALLLPLLVLNIVVGVVTYNFVVVVGETIDPLALATAHLLSVPYFLVCGGIGLLVSVSVDRAAVAERLAAGLVFALWLIESVVGTATNFARIRFLSPTHYYDPTLILVEGTSDPLDAGILLVIFLALLAASQHIFRRRDV